MKRKLLMSCLLAAFIQNIYAQSVGIGTTTPHASAQLDIASSSKGVLIPRMTTTSINSIAGPAKGLFVYDSSLNELMVNVGNPVSPNWQAVKNNSGNSGWSLTGNNGTNSSTHFIGTTDHSPLLFRINNKHAGIIDSVSASTFLGYRAGNNNPVEANTAVGYLALSSITSGWSNVAIGVSSLSSNTEGKDNVGIGNWSLKSNTVGSNNIAVGSNSLQANTSGSYNSSIGDQALYRNTTGWYNTAIGGRSVELNTTGSQNTGIGYAALYSNTTGSGNSAIGHSALFFNSTGKFNSALGNNALLNNRTGDYNAAIGHLALNQNLTGYNNSAFGAFALSYNTTGIQNTAIGNTAMYNNTTGNDNVALGISVLRSNTTGYKNTAAGWAGMYNNTTGYYNAAFGDGSLFSNTTGVGNTAVGSGALYSTKVSNYNTAYGYHTGFENDLGWNNTLIGAECAVTVPGVYNSIALGNGTTITGIGQARIGNFGTTSIGGYKDWTHFSDGRFKKNIKDDVQGLDFIMKLRPVTYQLDISSLSDRANNQTKQSWNEDMKKTMIENEKIIETGFIAQEVEQVAKELGYDFSGVDKPQNENDFYGLRYAQFVVPLVKAVQEQQHMIQTLQIQINDLQKKIKEIGIKQ